jgi:AAA ATPase-like protein
MASVANWYRCDVPGRDRDLAWLGALYETAVTEGRGRIVFVVGDEGCGRSALLHALPSAAERVSKHTVVLAGDFEDGSYVAWDIGGWTAASRLRCPRHPHQRRLPIETPMVTDMIANRRTRAALADPGPSLGLTRRVRTEPSQVQRGLGHSAY